MNYNEADCIYDINSVSFAYPHSSENALNNVSLSINRGDFVVICGASGCGKTTLLRHLKPEMLPSGTTSGIIKYKRTQYNNMQCDENQRRSLVSGIGFVSQEADAQLATDMVWHELAFGLENLGYGNQVIRKRVAECASFFGLQGIFNEKVSTLSGGQKQLVNLASVMVMRPEVVILDEPVSQLDPISAGSFINMLGRINRETGTTIVISEHRLGELFGLCNRVVFMDRGSIISDAGVNEAVRTVATDPDGRFSSIAAAMPAAIRISSALGERESYPVSVADGRTWLKRWCRRNPNDISGCRDRRTESIGKKNEVQHDNHDPAVCLNDVWFRYKNAREDVLKGVDLSIPAGQVYSVVGGNAAGKSTLLQVIAGTVRPYRGNIRCSKGLSVLYIPQKPELLFSEDTVDRELSRLKGSLGVTDEAYNGIVNDCCLNTLMTRNPFDLSGGEKQRLAFAIALLRNGDIILLDEPTKGMDAMYKEKFAGLLHGLASNGKTIIFVSHDLEFCAGAADRCGMLFDGLITTEGGIHDFFIDNSYYTTPAVMMTRGIVDGCVTIGDVIDKLTGEGKESGTDLETNAGMISDKCMISDTRLQADEDNFDVINNVNHDINTVLMRKGSMLFTAYVYLVVIPVTLWMGISLLNDRKYYFISLLIIIEAMLPFFVNFERSRPGVRKIVIMSVLCAICVAGRQAFYMLPGCKPVVALVMISGMAMGAESGFIIGAMTMLVSNIFFGQGPWTPWQMFAMGMVGLVSGLAFHRSSSKSGSGAVIRHSLLWKLRLSGSGILISLIIYSGIVNLCMPFVMQADISTEVILATYVSGLPFDLLLAGSTGIILFLLAGPMLGRIGRVSPPICKI